MTNRIKEHQDSEHDHGHECECCANGMEAFRAKEDANMAKYGWFAHIVQDDVDVKTGYNYHTHGIPATWPGAMDIQVVLPLPPPVTHNLAVSYVNLLKKGIFPKDGDVLDGIIKGYKVRMAAVEENDRTVLRMILPQKDGRLENFDVEEYAAQI